MYYSRACPYCSKIFYVFQDIKEEAAREMFEGLQKHEKEYGEDKKDPTLQEYEPEIEINMIYEDMEETDVAPPGGYPVENV